MDHIEQLKKIRSDAITRMRSSPDFKLAGKLGALIMELGETVDDAVDYSKPNHNAPEKQAAKPFERIFDKKEEGIEAEKASDGMIDELVAEIEDDAQHLSENPKHAKDSKVGPFVKPNGLRSSYTNGASH